MSPKSPLHSVAGDIKGVVKVLAEQARSVEDFFKGLENAGILGKFIKSPDTVNELHRAAQRSVRRRALTSKILPAIGAGGLVGGGFGYLSGLHRGSSDAYSVKAIKTSEDKLADASAFGRTLATMVDRAFQKAQARIKSGVLKEKDLEKMVSDIVREHLGQVAKNTVKGRGFPYAYAIGAGAGAALAGFTMGYDKAFKKVMGKKAEDLDKEAGTLKTLGVGALGLGLGGALGFGVGKKVTQERMIEQFREMVPRIANITTPRERAMIQQAYALGYQRALNELKAKNKGKKKKTAEDKRVKELEKKIAELEKELEAYRNREKIAEAASLLVERGIAPTFDDALQKVAEYLQQGNPLEKLLEDVKKGATNRILTF